MNTWNIDQNNVVVGGNDVVAYFKENEAVRGLADHSTEYNGGTFHFSSQENLEAFRKDPQKYAPKFGGFCAFGVAAKKAKAPTNPMTFKIYNGELLLFFNDLYEGNPVNTKEFWEQDENNLYSQATNNWSTLE